MPLVGAHGSNLRCPDEELVKVRQNTSGMNTYGHARDFQAKL
jgi:hypothetical protein